MKKFIALLFITLSALSFSSCKKEEDKGELKIYATCLEPYVDAACKRFEQQTGIKTSFEFLSSSIILEKAKNGTNEADIWFGGTSDPYNEAASLDLLYPYKEKNSRHLIDQKYRDKNYYWYGIYVGVLGFFWNQDELDKRNLVPPVDWDDLLKPEYKGLIVFGNPATSGTGKLIVNTLVQVKGKDAAMDYFHQLDKNVAEYTALGVSPAIMVSKNQAVIGIGFLHDILRQMFLEDTALNMTTPISGTSYEIGATAIFKNAKNLNNAKKFIEYALSPDCVNLASENGAYQMVVLDNAKPVNPAISAGLDKIETIDFDLEDAKINGAYYCQEFFKNVHKDNRFKTSR